MRRIPGRSTAPAQGRIPIDRGTESGIEPGDRVLFRPLGQPERGGRVESVAQGSAWVTLDDPRITLDAGTACEIQIPPDRTLPGGAEHDYGTGNEHPTWSRPPDDWQRDMPLLADARKREASDRATVWSGRYYTSAEWTDDRLDAGRKYLFARGGVDARATNPFGLGGEFHFDGEVNHRIVDLPNTPKRSESRLRLDRLSWTWGGTREHALRWEVGRFLQHLFPEFGVIDGGEFDWRSNEGLQFGASLGLQPEPNADYASTDDRQAAVFAEYLAGERGAFELGAGFQRTWHKGKEDRNLIVARTRWRGASGFRFDSSVWVDLYGPEDTAKGSGAELTQFRIGGGYNSKEGNGYRISYNALRFPELLRFQVSTVSAVELANNHNERIGFSGWRRLGSGTRLELRLNRWSDQDDSGGGVEVRSDWRDFPFRGASFGLGLFADQGKFSSAYGLRANQSTALGNGFLRFSWESARYDQKDFFGTQAQLLQHLLRASWDFASVGGFSASLSLDLRLGDQQDSTTLGLYLQKGF